MGKNNQTTLYDICVICGSSEEKYYYTDYYQRSEVKKCLRCFNDECLKRINRKKKKTPIN